MVFFMIRIAGYYRTMRDICEALKTAMTSITFEGITATSTGITWSADGEPNKDPLVVKIVNGAYEIQ